MKSALVFASLILNLASLAPQSLAQQAPESIGAVRTTLRPQMPSTQLIHWDAYNPAYGKREVLGVRYSGDDRTGQAWVDVDYMDLGRSSESYQAVITLRAQVPGLSYNRLTGETLYNLQGVGPTACSQLVDGEHVPTGDCTVFSRTGLRTLAVSEGYGSSLGSAAQTTFDVYFSVRQ